MVAIEVGPVPLFGGVWFFGECFLDGDGASDVGLPNEVCRFVDPPQPSAARTPEWLPGVREAADATLRSAA